MSLRPRHTLVLLALCCPGLAAAEAYAGFSAGSANWLDSCNFTQECDNRNATGTIRGGYRLSSHFAVEGRYIDLGRVSRVIQRINVSQQGDSVITTSGVEDRFSARGWGAGAVATWPVTTNSAISLTGGIARLRAATWYRVGFSDNPTTAEDRVTHARAFYGLRASYAVTRNVDLSLEAERYKVKTFMSGTPDVETLSAGVTWNFR